MGTAKGWGGCSYGHGLAFLGHRAVPPQPCWGTGAPAPAWSHPNPRTLLLFSQNLTVINDRGAEQQLADAHSSVKARLVWAYFGFPFNQKSIRQFPNEYSSQGAGCQAGWQCSASLCVFQFRVIQCIKTKQGDEEEKNLSSLETSPQTLMELILHSRYSKHPPWNAWCLAAQLFSFSCPLHLTCSPKDWGFLFLLQGVCLTIFNLPIEINRNYATALCIGSLCAHFPIHQRKFLKSHWTV